MAAIDPVSARVSGTDRWTHTWTGITTTSDTAAAIALNATNGSGHKRITMQAGGTFAGGSSLTLHGSLDGVNYSVLEDKNGDAAALTGAGIAEYDTCAVFVKPVVTSGSADNVNVILAVA